MKKQRLDLLLVERGLAPSRERARALILAGQVRAGDLAGLKPGTSVPSDVDVVVLGPDHPWVGRGGIKLAHALDVFAIDVRHRRALDIGASTGGFTDVLLQRGAAHVVALDVGHNQIDWKLRQHPRVTVKEGVNARYLTASDLPGPMDVVTIDVSFISLGLIFPVLPPLLAPHADVVALVKPQFEAGRDEVGRGGIVKDPAVHARVLAAAGADAAAVGLRTLATAPSPVTGSAGNREFLMHLGTDTR